MAARRSRLQADRGRTVRRTTRRILPKEGIGRMPQADSDAVLGRFRRISHIVEAQETLNAQALSLLRDVEARGTSAFNPDIERLDHEALMVVSAVDYIAVLASTGISTESVVDHLLEMA